MLQLGLVFFFEEVRLGLVGTLLVVDGTSKATRQSWRRAATGTCAPDGHGAAVKDRQLDGVGADLSSHSLPARLQRMAA